MPQGGIRDQNILVLYEKSKSIDMMYMYMCLSGYIF